jgi:hypothetical protein
MCSYVPWSGAFHTSSVGNNRGMIVMESRMNLLYAGCLLVLFFDPEYVGDMFLWSSK